MRQDVQLGPLSGYKRLDSMTDDEAETIMMWLEWEEIYASMIMPTYPFGI